VGFAQAQDLEKKQAEQRTPHFLSLNQDIVASLQDEIGAFLISGAF
jgi:hypothetical protein